MSDLAQKLTHSGELPWQPRVFALAEAEDRAALEALFAEGAITTVRDDYEEQLREYHAYLHPTLAVTPDREPKFQEYKAVLEAAQPLWQHGRWVFYPWRNALVHVLEANAYQQIRTSRNRNLITEAEQQKFADAVVGVAGLSVGNSVALSLVLSGGANHLRLADFDRLALSNVNRIRGSAVDFGSNKAEMTARQIFELNPYAKVELFTDGLTEDNVARFCDGLDVVIDEIDNLAVKCLLRQHARDLRLPLVMATDNGDNGIIDVERYDLDATIPFFHGRMGDVSYDSVKGLDKMSVGRLIVKFVGPETATPRTLGSMLEIGKSIVSWPQLGNAATLNGSAVSYCVRAIANGQPLEANRVLIDLDEKLVPGHNVGPNAEARAEGAKKFAQMFGL